MKTHVRRLGIGLTALVVTAHSALALPPGSTPREIELGENAAEDIAKTVVFVDDPEALAKLQKMLDEIAAATTRPDIKYKPHIIQSPLVNAFVIPGGWVYVTTALLDNAESDDEVAGVMAHEIAHNVEQHAIRRMREMPRGLGLLQLASIAALIIGKSPEAAVLAGTAANTITAAVLNGHTIEMEKEADAEGIKYLTRTQYNPTGFLTFLEKLASSSGKFIEEEMGIYRTHPLTRDRVSSAEQRLHEFNVPVLRRKVTDAPTPEIRPVDVGEPGVVEIVYRGKRLLLLAPSGDADNDAERAAQVVASIDWALDHELDESRIKIIPAEGGVLLAPERGPRFFLGTEDGRLNGKGEAILAADLRRTIAGLVLDDRTRFRANSVLH
ncbi:MAG: M48 family metalloprotease [Gemmatimonadetes bacterium]|nr:M48 family metalloprotease [Gemmatimonadota bacterium]